MEIQKVKPGAFSPGRPAEFLKNYKSSLEFLAKLEGTGNNVMVIYILSYSWTCILFCSLVDYNLSLWL